MESPKWILYLYLRLYKSNVFYSKFLIEYTTNLSRKGWESEEGGQRFENEIKTKELIRSYYKLKLVHITH